MAERVSRGYAILAALLAIQVALVLVYLGPWPGMGMSETAIAPNPAASVADVTMIAGLPTVAGDPALAVPAAPDVPSGGPAPSSALTIETSLDRGAAVAAEWDVEAPQLVAVQLQIDWPQNDVPETVEALADGGWLDYYYVDAGADLASTLVVRIERTRGDVEQPRVEASAIRGTMALDLDAVETWDTAAVLAIEMMGGTAFRAACPTVHYTTVAVLTVDAETGGPVWFIEYPESREGNVRPLIGRVDAVTGEAAILDPGNTDC